MSASSPSTYLSFGPQLPIRLQDEALIHSYLLSSFHIYPLLLFADLAGRCFLPFLLFLLLSSPVTVINHLLLVPTINGSPIRSSLEMDRPIATPGLLSYKGAFDMLEPSGLLD